MKSTPFQRLESFPDTQKVVIYLSSICTAPGNNVEYRILGAHASAHARCSAFSSFAYQIICPHRYLQISVANVPISSLPFTSGPVVEPSFSLMLMIKLDPPPRIRVALHILVLVGVGIGTYLRVGYRLPNTIDSNSLFCPHHGTTGNVGPELCGTSRSRGPVRHGCMGIMLWQWANVEQR
ncbi:hypothetical protein GGS20DRAFT_559978 [Poronia punctata]|nr:hypothetical protein GGS20DRAFT_559978 [Poronia punctata]